MLVKLSMNYCKKEDYDKGVTVLNKIQNYSNIPLDIQFLIANAYIQNKDFEKGLEIAYQFRVDIYLDPSVHTRYVQCITGMQNQASEVYYPIHIGISCTAGQI